MKTNQTLKTGLLKLEDIARIGIVAAAAATLVIFMFNAIFFRADLTFMRADLPDNLKRTDSSFEGCVTEGCMPGQPAWLYTYEITDGQSQSEALKSVSRSLQDSGFSVEADEEMASSNGPGLSAKIRNTEVTVLVNKYGQDPDGKHLYFSATNN